MNIIPKIVHITSWMDRHLGGNDLKQLLSLLTICLLVLGFTSPSYAQEDKDCGHFSTWKEAQHFYNTHDPDNDPHDLDRDGDGIVCETLAGFDVNYEAGTPLGDATTDTTDPTNDEGAGLAETATYYPVGVTIGLIVGTIGLFLLLFKRRTTIE